MSVAMARLCSFPSVGRSSRQFLISMGWLLVVALPACRGSWQPPPRLVTEEQAHRIKVLVEPPSTMVVLGDDRCGPLREQAAAFYEAAMRTALERAGFAVVESKEQGPHVVAEIKGGLEACWGPDDGSNANKISGKFLAYLKDPASGRAVAKGAQEAKKVSFEEVGERLASDMLRSREVAELAKGLPPAEPTAPVVAQAGTGAAPGGAALPPGAGAAPAPLAGNYKPGTPQPSAFALVVGIEQYRGFPSPHGAAADAQAFAALARTTLGVPEDNLRVLIDAAATRTTILKEVHWLKGNVAKDGRIYFYFSGHGAPDATTGVPYLLPADGDPGALEVTGLKVDEVMSQLEQTGAQEVVAFVDACFSGSGGRSVLPQGVRPLVRVKAVAAGARVAMLAAASGDEIAGPAADGKHGLFTDTLLQGLGSGQADLDGDGKITTEELAGWVTPRVSREAKRAYRQQTPHLIGPGGAVVTSGLR